MHATTIAEERAVVMFKKRNNWLVVLDSWILAIITHSHRRVFCSLYFQIFFVNTSKGVDESDRWLWWSRDGVEME